MMGERTPILLGMMLSKRVVGVSIQSPSDINKWCIDNYPAIVVWDCDKRIPITDITSLFHFWFDHGARTFVFGGRCGYRVEDHVVEQLAGDEKPFGDPDFILTSNSLSLPAAVWRGGFTGYVDTPDDVEPLVYIMLLGPVSRLREARCWVQRISEGWIPKDNVP